jgi:hypothetical protein
MIGSQNLTGLKVGNGDLVRIRDSDSNGGFRIAVIQITNEIVSDRHTAVIRNLGWIVADLKISLNFWEVQSVPELVSPVGIWYVASTVINGES